MSFGKYTGLTQVQAETARLKAKLTTLKNKYIQLLREYTEKLQEVDDLKAMDAKLNALQLRIDTLKGMMRADCGCGPSTGGGATPEPVLISCAGATSYVGFAGDMDLRYDWKIKTDGGEKTAQVATTVPEVFDYITTLYPGRLDVWFSQGSEEDFLEFSTVYNPNNSVPLILRVELEGTLRSTGGIYVDAPIYGDPDSNPTSSVSFDATTKIMTISFCLISDAGGIG